MQRREKIALPTMALAMLLLVCLGDTILSVSASTHMIDHGSLSNEGWEGLNPERKVPETSRLSLLTPYGPIRISLLSQNAPLTVNELIKESKRRLKAYNGCEFYRAEARATVGPPYGLIQGSFRKGMKLPKEKEGSRSIQAGDVVILPSSNDFYIALQDHPDWSSAHTVVGIVDDFVTPDLICIQPTLKSIHPTYSTEMQMLKERIDFVLTDDMSEMIMPKFIDVNLMATAMETNEDYEYEYVEDGQKEEPLDQVEERMRSFRKQGDKSKPIRAPATKRNRRTGDSDVWARDGVINNKMVQQGNDRWDDAEDQEAEQDMDIREPSPRHKRPSLVKHVQITEIADDDTIKPPNIKSRRKKRVEKWDLSAQEDEILQEREEGDERDETEEVY